MNALIANVSLPLNFTTPIGRSVQAGHRSPSYNQNDLMVSPNCAFACSYNLPMISSITSLLSSDNLSCLVGLDSMCEPPLKRDRENGHSAVRKSWNNYPKKPLRIFGEVPLRAVGAGYFSSSSCVSICPGFSFPNSNDR